MTNPFTYGSPLEDPRHFADRERERAEIASLMLDGQNVILLSPRRYGKTSLLLRCVEDVRRARGRTGYANLARCTSRREVAEELLRAVVAGPLGWMRRRRHGIAELLGHLRVVPEVTFTADGLPVVRLTGARSDEEWGEVVADALRLLRAAHVPDHPASLVIDEFQQIAEIPPGLGGLFKFVVDELRAVSLVLSGSAAHLMSALAEGAAAPLYGIGERIHLPVVPEADMVAHLRRRATAGGRPMGPEAAAAVFRRAGPVPNDVQRLAYHAFALASAAVTVEDVDRAVALVVRHEASEYQRRFERLAGARAQQRILKRLAAAPTDQPYSRAFLHDVELGNSNAVRKALAALEQRELVSRREGLWLVDDPFFRAWLSRPPGTV